MPITSAVATGEVAEARRFGRRVPGTFKCGGRENTRVVPQAGAKQLHAFEVYATGGKRLHNLRYRIRAVGNKDAVDLARDLAHATCRFGHPVRVGWVFFQCKDAAAVSRHFLLEGGLNHRAVGIIGQECRK